MRDVQQRLSATGFPLERAEVGHYGDRTAAAVAAFQARRGLLVTGTCDAATWSALVEAGYRLGDRALYLRSPMVRGDDVHLLQQRLGALGFDAGRVDGIYGPDTDQALRQFQHNAGLRIDGVCGPEVCAALDRLGARTTNESVSGVRERERLLTTPPGLHGRRIVVGQHGGLDVLATTIGRLLHDGGATVAVLHHPDPSTHAREANAFAAELYLGLAVDGEPRCRVAFYQTDGFQSAGGASMAGVLVDALPLLGGLVPGTAVGLRLPVLRETRMPAVVCLLGPTPTIVERSAAVAGAVAVAVRRWVDAPVEG